MPCNYIATASARLQLDPVVLRTMLANETSRQGLLEALGRRYVYAGERDGVFLFHAPASGATVRVVVSATPELIGPPAEVQEFEATLRPVYALYLWQFLAIALNGQRSIEGDGRLRITLDIR